MMEGIHAETYSRIIDELVKDPVLKSQLQKSVKLGPDHPLYQKYECIRKKCDWATKYFDKSKYSFAERLVAFAAIEAVAFSSSFCSIFWLGKKGGLFPGLVFANSLISRDEKMHADFACLLFSMIPEHLRPSRARIIEIISELVELEKLQSKESLKQPLRGMNQELINQYVEYVADNLFIQLGYKKFYNSVNPFDWMEKIAIHKKTNFFEMTSGEYKNSRVQSNSAENRYSKDTEGW
jgi:ribonucleotide reductase beta subunit family protein with ferritin-like domain